MTKTSLAITLDKVARLLEDVGYAKTAARSAVELGTSLAAKKSARGEREDEAEEGEMKGGFKAASQARR